MFAQQEAEQQDAEAQVHLIPVDQVSAADGGMKVNLDQDLSTYSVLSDSELPADMVPEGSKAVLASRIVEYTVVEENLEEIGLVSGAMVNLGEHTIEYIAVAPTGELGLTQAMYAVPPQRVQDIVYDNHFVLNVSEGELNYFTPEEEEWPDTMDETMGPETEGPALEETVQEQQ
jgi:sporulation protein YlmC with PRC-barrel domain